MKKYELVNLEGCTFDKTEAENIKKAKEILKNGYSGKFKIYESDEQGPIETYNVNFK